MSRTTLCVLTAGALVASTLGMGVLRYQVMGEESHVPQGPNSYRVTMTVYAQSVAESRLLTICPLDFGHQHIFAEEYGSDELAPKLLEPRLGERRAIQWLPRLGSARGLAQARYEFSCTVDVHRPTGSMTQLHKVLHAAPKPGEEIAASPGIDPSDPEMTRLALRLTAGLDGDVPKVRALFDHVSQEISRAPRPPGAGLSATACLRSGRGDALAQSRLLAALCRNRGIPARLVTGLTLGKTIEQKAHTWVEAWVGDYWMPLCPFHHYCGRVPATFLVFGYGDLRLARGKHLRDLDYAFLVEPHAAHLGAAEAEELPPLRWFFSRISLHSLPPAETHLVEFLLLLPVAALLICIFRNLIGLQSFGTFAPALVGLAFRDIESVPGILIFVSIVLVGWGMRRLLDRYHLLQVPRTAFMLSLVVILLIGLIVVANFQHVAATRYISLFPLVILTGMIERFWTMESENGTWSSFKTLLGTLLIAATISLIVSIPTLMRHLVSYPETIGVVMAGQLLLGRYTGYRLSELYRFRDFLRQANAPAHLDGDARRLAA